MPLFLIFLCGRFFLFLVLDKVICPFLVKYFEMPIWHPTSEKALDELLDAKVDMCVIPLLYSISMCLTKCLFCFICCVKGAAAKKNQVSMLNKNIAHLIDDIFWHMGFKTETQADKVINAYHAYYTYYVHYINYAYHRNYSYYINYVCCHPGLSLCTLYQ